MASSYKPEHDKFVSDPISRISHGKDGRPAYEVYWDCVIGRGSSGSVHLASLPDWEPAAFKCADMYNREEWFEGLLKEARMLYYAQELGLSCTPKIYLSGHSNGLYINLIEYLDEEKYYVRKRFKEMSHQEERMFRDALIELASHGIRHNDIEPRHIYFARDGSRCVIIDYGNGEIEKDSSTLELEFWFDEEKLRIKQDSTEQDIY